MKQIVRSDSVCPKCHTIFECGISAGKDSCWCFAHQALLLSDYGDRCFCEKCLKELIELQLVREEKLNLM